LKIARVSIIVWSNNNGSGNILDNDSNRFKLNRIIEYISDSVFNNIPFPSDPAISPDSNYYLTDSQIRLQLDGIEFINNSTYAGMVCSDHGAQLGASNLVDSLYPYLRRSLKIHLIRSNAPLCGGPDNLGAGSGPPLLYSAGQWNENTQLTAKSISHPTIEPFYYDTFLIDAEKLLRGRFSHELGHVFGLFHTYGSQLGGTESNSSAGVDFLSDVYSCYQQFQNDTSFCNTVDTNCTANSSFCWFNGQGSNTGVLGNCDPYASPFDGCSNNLMGGNVWAASLTNMQIGRMHRTAMFSNLSKYVYGYNPIPFVLSFGFAGNPAIQNGSLDIPVKYYQDLRIRSGNVFEVNCEVHMVPGSRIVVEPGARLIINGGVIKAATFSDTTWLGIEVWGSDSLDHTPVLDDPWAANTLAHQGVLELVNGGRIENAEIGILLGSRDEPGKGGGVVRAFGTSSEPVFITNCGTGIRYQPYPMPNGSILRHIAFTRDANALPSNGEAELKYHIYADRVRDLDIRACAFSNTQPGITTSTALGQGITSANSTLTVRPGCPNGGDECPGQTLVRNTFTNLDHGIELFDTGFGSYANIHQNDFTNNIAGIYANGMTGFAVTENLFTVGDNAVELVGEVDERFENRHRALFSTVSYGFVVRDNTLMQATTGVAQPMSGTEGIVVGYTRDFNDVVYRNQSTGLERAYIGEGVCADVFPPNNAKLIGLQFQCNTNTDNKVNIWSRLIESAPVLEQPQHTIRGYQGHKQKADNRFDRWDPNDPTLADYWDFNVNTTFTPILYSHRDPVSPASIGYVPWSVPNDPLRFQGLPVDDNFGGCGALLPLIPYDPGDNGSGMAEDQEEFGTLKYLYDQMMDGGSTDEVVQEIVSSWPSEAWQLRQYLLGLSPFLSMESLKQAVNKPNFPMAMKAEVCIANPDATQKEGFIKWLELEANEPMPAYLIAMIKASWETKTFRTDMELELADLHTAICQRATEMLYVEHQKPVPSAAQLRWIWQQVRTTAARYAEANVLLAQGNFAAARTVIQDMPVDKALKAPEVVEQQRMLSYISILETAASAGRGAHELVPSEVNELKTLSVEQYDRPANWISNLLCLYYSECRSPLTGGNVGGEKSLRPAVISKEELVQNAILLAPNPTQTWATVTYTLTKEAIDGLIEVKDAMGRPVLSERLVGKQGQVVLDTRPLAKGAYVVQCSADGVVLVTERLIVQ
jgi:hypothetical protein